MHIDWDRDHRPAWDIALHWRTLVTWDEHDRARLAKVLEATGKARHVAVVADGERPACRLRLRLKAESGPEAMYLAVVVMETAAEELGITLGDVVHVAGTPARS